MSTDLKPCPFCGSATTLDDERLLWVASCTGCGACVLGDRAPEPEQEMPAAYWEPFRQSAVDRWNRRAALAQPEPAAPTDEQWDALKERVWDAYQTIGYQGERFMYNSDFDTALDVVRHKLARCGTPTTSYLAPEATNA
jgi:hypothetical protein